MTRVKRGTIKNKRRKNILAQTKGFRFGRSTKVAQAKDALSTQATILLPTERTRKPMPEPSGQPASMPQFVHSEFHTAALSTDSKRKIS
jgi:hypothetical protein